MKDFWDNIKNIDDAKMFEILLGKAIQNIKKHENVHQIPSVYVVKYLSPVFATPFLINVDINIRGQYLYIYEIRGDFKVLILFCSYKYIMGKLCT